MQKVETRLNTCAVTKCNDLAISVDADVDVSITDFEAIDELPDIDVSDLGSLVGI